MPQFRKPVVSLATISLCLLLFTQLSQAVTFTQRSFPGHSSPAHADLNHDGREDFVYPGSGGFFVKLSTGDGVYGAATRYTLPGGAFAFAIGIGDFNGDGQPDLMVASNSNLFEFVNKGNGAFQFKTAFPVSSVNDLVVADFNHDGHMDLAIDDGLLVEVWFGDGKGGFTPGPSTSATIAGYLLLGDFDGDGNADVAIGDLTNFDTVQILYGDSTGHFPATSFVRRTADHSLFSAADVNGDGKMDVVASTFFPTALNHISVYYGNAARTWTETKIPISHCASNTAAPSAADFNGDGRNDLIVPESDCGGTGTATRRIGILTRNSSGGYNPDQIVYSSSSPALILFEVEVLRADRNTKPDISFSQCNSTPCSIIGHYNLRLLLNTTAGSFPTCAPPNAFLGIQVCSPLAGSTVTSPVHFRVGAAGQTPMRKVEVWVDGHKVTQQLDGFSRYTFMDQNVTISPGAHKVTVFGAGWDNWLEKTSFTLNVK